MIKLKPPKKKHAQQKNDCEKKKKYIGRSKFYGCKEILALIFIGSLRKNVSFVLVRWSSDWFYFIFTCFILIVVVFVGHGTQIIDSDLVPNMNCEIYNSIDLKGSFFVCWCARKSKESKRLEIKRMVILCEIQSTTERRKKNIGHNNNNRQPPWNIFEFQAHI